jgi:serine/threonine-protein kinase
MRDFREREIAKGEVPPVFSDAYASWQGVYSDRPELPVQVDAAAFAGRPVFFQMHPADTSLFQRNEELQARQYEVGFADRAAPFIMLVTVTAGAWLARRNWRLGRANRTGALRLALVVFASAMLCWSLLAHHSFKFGEEYYGLFVPTVGNAVQVAGLIWLMYMALEPYVRRRWPWRIVSWNRLLDGRWRDPLIGRDILVGAFAAVWACAIMQVMNLVPLWLKQAPLRPILYFFDSDQFTKPAGMIASMPLYSVMVSISLLFLLLVLVVMLRREWLGVGAYFVLAVCAEMVPGITKQNPEQEMNLVHVAFYLVLLSLLVATNLFVLLKFGLLASATGYLYGLLYVSPVTTDVTVWYFSTSVTYLLVFSAIAAYAFYISLGNRPLFAPGWLDER